jgi:hypothetical protein
MKTTTQLYKQFLINTQLNYTCTYLSEHTEKLDENSVYRFLKSNQFSPKYLWEKAKQLIVLNPNGYLIFDDTVLDKNYSFEIEGVRSQYSGNAHKVIKGIGVVNCVYYNPELDQYWIIDFRIYDPDQDGKDKLDHVRDMIDMAGSREIAFQTVLMDSWYATTGMMMKIDGIKKIYYCPLKSNRLVDDSDNTEPYKRVDKLIWTKEDLESGKIVKVKKFPMDTKVKLFRVIISNDKTEHIITNDMSQDSTEDCQKEAAIRWNIEQFHREEKQLTGIDKCQCTTNRSQRNHICLAMQVWLFLSDSASKSKVTIYQVKRRLLDDYLVNQMRFPSLPVTE